MTKLSRVCTHCGQQGELNRAYCAHCGMSTSGHQEPNFSASRSPLSGNGTSLNLPLQLRSAALPLLAGAAGLVIRAGWRLMQSRTAREVAFNTAASVVRSNFQLQHSADDRHAQSAAIEQSKKVQPAPTYVRQNKRTIRIRSRWAVGDAGGQVRQGQSEHTIEIDD